jgi:hypothetical protein
MMADEVENRETYTLLRESRHADGYSGWLETTPHAPDVEEALSEGRGVELRFSRSSRTVLELALDIYRVARAVHDCPYDPEPVSVIMTELVQNGLKANFKKAWFRQEGIAVDDPVQYRQALVDFKKLIGREPSMLAELARSSGLMVRVQFFVRDSRCLKLRVINTAPLFAVESARIREKISNAFQYDNLVDFLMEHRDETEGAGLGMLVILLSLKSLGLARDRFSVFQDDQGHTVACVRFSW